ncbi:hypothetical protein B484DRAFT_405385 [Ochromonadaceae sp. CCMP2298]|nr:hypothetical protein B484DRAFT_405385 [Ochromonadaceae sp. CCMP2298]
MSGQRVLTDGVGVLADGQLTVNGIEAASGSFENLSSQELALHEDQIAQNTADILALQSGTNVIGTATQTALDLKLDKTAAPTRISLGIDQTDNTSDLAKPISTATQVALDDLGQTNSMAVALAHVTMTTPVSVNRAWNNTGGSNVWNVTVSSIQYIITRNAAPWPEQLGPSLRKKASNEAENNGSFPPTDSLVEFKVGRIFANEIFTKRIEMPPPVCGVWMVNAGDGDLKIDNAYPIFCSLKNAGKRDDQMLVGPGFKVVCFFYADYVITPGARPWPGSTDTASQTRTIDNTTGRSIVSRTTNQLYGTGNGTNTFDKTGSLKLYYNDIEIKLQTFS